MRIEKATTQKCFWARFCKVGRAHLSMVHIWKAKTKAKKVWAQGLAKLNLQISDSKLGAYLESQKAKKSLGDQVLPKLSPCIYAWCASGKPKPTESQS